jgi:hypothetical protein
MLEEYIKNKIMGVMSVPADIDIHISTFISNYEGNIFDNQYTIKFHNEVHNEVVNIIFTKAEYRQYKLDQLLCIVESNSVLPITKYYSR